MKIPTLLLAAALSGAASALTLDLLPAQQTASPGATVSFFGTLTNDGLVEVALTGNGFSEVSGDFAGFVIGDLGPDVPFTLAPSESFTGLVFEVVLPATATVGDRFGRYSVFGDDGTGPVLVESPFGIQVVPEPASLAALGTGALAIARRRARRKRPS